MIVRRPGEAKPFEPCGYVCSYLCLCRYVCIYLQILVFGNGTNFYLRLNFESLSEHILHHPRKQGFSEGNTSLRHYTIATL